MLQRPHFLYGKIWDSYLQYLYISHNSQVYSINKMA